MHAQKAKHVCLKFDEALQCFKVATENVPSMELDLSSLLGVAAQQKYLLWPSRAGAAMRNLLGLCFFCAARAKLEAEPAASGHPLRKGLDSSADVALTQRCLTTRLLILFLFL